MAAVDALATRRTEAMTAEELDKLLTVAFGEDYRQKSLVGPLGVFALAGAFEECGLTDPAQRPSAFRCVGLPQPMPVSHLRHVFGGDPEESLAVAVRYVRERYGSSTWETWQPPWPLSRGPQSPHGDAVLSPHGRR